MFNIETATLVGEGEWVKGSAYRVYSQDDRYFAVLMSGTSNLDVDSVTEITQSEISEYI